MPFEPPRYTYDIYKNWDENWELIEGSAYSLLPSPTVGHQRTVVNFLYQIVDQLKKQGDTCCNAYSRLDWIMNNTTVVRPDVMVVTPPFETDWLQFAPTLIVEVVSESSSFVDEGIKKYLYETNGVKYYLIADVANRKIECFELMAGVYLTKTGSHFQLTDDVTVHLDYEGIWD